MVDINKKPNRRIIREPEVRSRTGFSTSWIYELMKKDLMPRNFKIAPGGRASGWYEDEIDDWINSRRDGGDK